MTVLTSAAAWTFIMGISAAGIWGFGSIAFGILKGYDK